MVAREAEEVANPEAQGDFRIGVVAARHQDQRVDEDEPIRERGQRNRRAVAASTGTAAKTGATSRIHVPVPGMDAGEDEKRKSHREQDARFALGPLAGRRAIARCRGRGDRPRVAQARKHTGRGIYVGRLAGTRRALDLDVMSGTTERGAKILLAASIALALAGAGCGSSDYALRRDADQRLSDRVGRELSTAPALSAAKVEARSHWGVVALVGEAPDEESKREAERIARAVAGVARVNNLILVVKGDSRAEGSAPAKGALILARTN